MGVPARRNDEGAEKGEIDGYAPGPNHPVTSHVRRSAEKSDRTICLTIREIRRDVAEAWMIDFPTVENTLDIRWTVMYP